ncbi:DUF4276 family protein [Chitinophaga sedimenti]|uniref:DUF4276 family protein n=1 Tax=Chitinophaga sedimenti TaxID=2033606 RepID=UPI00200638D8|nr:DUF4276 family protein [Chitinophaga sedimenti]MCK7556555.1 DUF4276 family protein [Chitinophaga sedimenti]
MIQPIGSITKTRRYLEKITSEGVDGVLLIDLDASKSQAAIRRTGFGPDNASKVYFMIQEMEAWIISQIDCLSEYAANEGYIRKRESEVMKNNPLIKDKKYEELVKPSGLLDTIFRQYFDVKSTRGGKIKAKGKRYSKTQDGPNLVALLDVELLCQEFEDAQRLFRYLYERSVEDIRTT